MTDSKMPDILYAWPAEVEKSPGVMLCGQWAVTRYPDQAEKYRKATPVADAEVDALIHKLQEAYALVSLWPENRPEGFMDLLGLRNLVPEALTALRARTAQPVGVMSAATNDVLSERQRQIDAEGWTHVHDDAHVNGEMAQAAACYALNAAGWKTEALRGCWPIQWMAAWFKPTNRRRDLVKAGALILAEIERLDRAAAEKEAQ